ncbi:MAG: ribonuclease H-like domain-containing protein [Deltaproteobacteria bacterium]|nr:ribonuclease H-like domain-containing protein [Deltaproteobacteria bacterium]
MLKNTFCHIPGVGLRSERRLWKSGILSWEACLRNSESPLLKDSFKSQIEASLKRLGDCDPVYFAGLLNSREHWRIFPDFRPSTAYLDIETNGYVGPRGYITAISLYDGKTVHSYVKGENLDEFKRDIRRYKVIVTYNGKCFDVPFIEHHMRIDLKQIAHIDLRYLLRDLGFSGGLKGCEKTLGIDRGELDGVDGYSAVLLWNDFKRNKNKKALETLLAYNAQDVVNLEPLSVIAYNLKLAGTPFERTHQLPMPDAPPALFKADIETIERIHSERHRYVSAEAY